MEAAHESFSIYMTGRATRNNPPSGGAYCATDVVPLPLVYAVVSPAGVLEPIVNILRVLVELEVPTSLGFSVSLIPAFQRAGRVPCNI